MKKTIDIRCPWCEATLKVPHTYSLDKNHHYKTQHVCVGAGTGGSLSEVTVQIDRLLLH